MLDPFGIAFKRLSRSERSHATVPKTPRHRRGSLTTPGWPESTPTVRLPSGESLRLRPLLRRDGASWRDMRLADERYLRPVEPTLPEGWFASHTPAQWWNYLVGLREVAKAGQAVPLAIEVDGAFAGQLTLGGIQCGSSSECWIGYWVFSGYVGRGVATAACALGVDHAFLRVGVHRVTATFLPTNPASGRVLYHCGFHDEGFLRRNLHIDGQWRDHHFVAQVADDFPDTCVARLRVAGRLR